MRILHTSDWHLGRALYGRQRYGEYEALLQWLLLTLQQQEIDLLLVAGDIFDTSTPGNRAQALYYDFLRDVQKSGCRHVVITAGNHDSPAFLEVPRRLLQVFNIHVRGACSADPADDLIVLRDDDGLPEAIVAAIPYLRERDVRRVTPGESVVDKGRNLTEGIAARYAATGRAAVALQQQFAAELKRTIPLLAMGHLFAAGATTSDGDGVRDLYVGSLAHLPGNIFPPEFDYVALGHIHQPQVVNGGTLIRYSGAPIAHSFGELHQTKSVVLVDFANRDPAETAKVELLRIPSFQRLAALQGDWDEISGGLTRLAASGDPVLLEVVYDGTELIGNLSERLEELVAGSPLELVRIKDNHKVKAILQQGGTDESLNEIEHREVFERLLQLSATTSSQKEELLATYLEAIAIMEEEERETE